MSVVLFSGGCDSTLVLYEQAMRRMKKDAPEYPAIIALSISHDQIPSQVQQKEAREKIKVEFKKRELDRYVNFLEIDIKQTGGGIGNIGGLMQPIIWVPTASLYCSSNDSVYFGYHKGDDYWMYKTESETAFYNFCKVQDKLEVKIEYPLKDMTKSNVINNLKERGLYDFCWYCEKPIKVSDKPEYTSCGECYPCHTHKTALWQLDNLKGSPLDGQSLSIDTNVCKKSDAIPVEKDIALQARLGQLSDVLKDVVKEKETIQGS